MNISSTPPPLMLGFPPATAPAPVASDAEDETDRAGLESQNERDIRAIIQRLKNREQEVIAHENAHRAVGGSLVRGGGYDYVQGPDNRRYIAGGDVRIDTSPVHGDPEATMIKAEHIIRTALAPVDPSPQDLRVAGEAQTMFNQARIELQMAQYRHNEPAIRQAPGQLLDQVA
jgi:hypothetical protein